MIGCTCIAIAISIYAYTIFAMKQETFLDDFDMPDPLLEEDRNEEWYWTCLVYLSIDFSWLFLGNNEKSKTVGPRTF